MSRFAIHDTPLPGLKVVERMCAGDSRGYIARLFCAEELRSAGWIGSVAQINYAYTDSFGVVRGMHFQHPPHAEAKLVNCLAGEVWDVAVDIRRGSPTFLRWHAELLSAKNLRALLIPEGFAHGYQTLSAGSTLLYIHSAAYHPTSEGGIRPLDSALGITWPLSISDVSERDGCHPLLGPDFEGIEILGTKTAEGP
jgi:dTDP-4-dehydrorhamnose 3,5-epimerase